MIPKFTDADFSFDCPANIKTIETIVKEIQEEYIHFWWEKGSTFFLAYLEILH